jgi:hypothetical protein
MSEVEKELRLIGFQSVTLGPRKYPNRQETLALGQDHLLPIINISITDKSV